MLKAIIIGASSGIGKALAQHLSQKGYTLGLTGRRVELLNELKKELPNPTFIKRMNVTQYEEAMKILQELIQEMGGMDLMVINAGVRFFNDALHWKEEFQTISTNVTGFAAMANVAFNYFKQQNHGHLVGISSIAALKFSGRAPAYSASKAFELNYMKGLRTQAVKLKKPIFVTDVRPGFVDTAMVKDALKFWVSSPEKAALQIYEAIGQKKQHVYITKRWQFIAWLMKFLPEFLYKKA
ncbi:MAG: SDR family NAD(P)-dependent oxidoreductase [Chlamydiae bacterium]|nr:SDR family NAD(P)-dependent oxidoreductase [Chlamydiota bacterium]MBI3276367.1 SDR family NAD(P)-dependent oxidoreductase [Chlamydiota bacterium]